MRKLILFAFVSLIFFSCEKDDPIVPHEEELITTMNLTLTPDSGEVVLFTFSDLDGDGGDDPSISTEALRANTVYSATLELLNATESPAEDITEEIREENEEHQFFFRSNAGLDLSVEYNDQDDSGNPLGVETNFSTGAPSSGQLIVTLRHEPNKSASGVSEGDISNAGGETDIEVTFDVVIE
ncbi:type 1 periplasmic binding fold superfamily protein [Membranihabitans maritimus]|uniref:type 1 periplasmic binding fold superfamily protein n=1 Tax=Membranihabitans maritimus TaxID=2904244 RepID=UPI001F3D0F5F|nr:type 1 periplasmic binding fold superfamily protein [Membranihabitans maritimus]